MPHKHQNCISN